MKSDWGVDIATNDLSVLIIYSLLFVLCSASIFIVSRHSYRHYTNPHKPEPKRRRVGSSVLMMAVPPVVMAAYLLYQLITKEYLAYSLSLTLFLIVLQLTWAASSFVIYRNQITMAIIVSRNYNTKIEWLKPFTLINSSLQFFVLSGCLIALYITKSDIIYRVYTGYSTFYVLTHIIPIWASSKLYNEVHGQLAQFAMLGADAMTLKRTMRTNRKIKSMRDSFFGTSMYLFNLIFVWLPQASPYYLIVVFFIGIISSLGALNIYPYLDKAQDSSDTQRSSKESDTGPNTSVIVSADPETPMEP